MTSDEVATFLTVAECRNITEAARRLFISQGATSTRIRHLEEELGVELFSRQRGVKNVQLTPEGECFATLARQWRSLEQQAHEIRNLLQYRELRIAAVDTINSFTFSGLYASYIRDNPRVKLYLQTEHSTEIHQLMEAQAVDMGFAFTLHTSPNVLSRPLYQEHMVVLCHQDDPYVASRDLGNLVDSLEIRSILSPEFTRWRARNLPTTTSYRALVGTVSMLPSLLREPRTWAVVSQSIAERFAQENPELIAVPFDGHEPPLRVAYVLYHRHPRPWVRELSRDFLDTVRAMVDQDPYLELIG